MEGFSATKVKMSDYDVLQTLGTGITTTSTNVLVNPI